MDHIFGFGATPIVEAAPGLVLGFTFDSYFWLLKDYILDSCMQSMHF